MTRRKAAPSRRGFLRAAGAAGLGAAASAGLAACSLPGLPPAALPRQPRDQSQAQHVVRFANWPYYIDRTTATGSTRYPTLQEFTRRTGITVDYSEPVTTNERFLGLLEVPLAMGWRSSYDLVVLSDWAVAELIELGWAHPLSPGLVPNAARLLPHFRGYPIPDIHQYSLPWQGGFTGIVYNSALTHRPVTSMRELLTAPDLHGKVALLTEMRDVLTLVMLDMNIDPFTFTSREFTAAVTAVGNAVQAGQFRTVTDYPIIAIAKNQIAASVGYAADMLNLQPNPHIKFSWPQTGGGLWTDNLLIPKGAQHADNAQRLMNYYYEPATAARLSTWNQYLDPVLGAASAMRNLTPALAAEKYIFPTPELLNSGHFFKNLTPEQNASYTARYLTAVGL